MITAHLPSGYVLAKLRKPGPWVMPATVIGAVLPDIGLIWFYFVDDRAFHHHRYLVHVPLFWLMITLPALAIMKIKFQRYLPAAIGFFIAILLHLCLDTIAGDIMWHWPFSDTFTHLVDIPTRFDNWIVNFILHPVFLLELLIWGAAIALAIKVRHQ